MEVAYSRNLEPPLIYTHGSCSTRNSNLLVVVNSVIMEKRSLRRIPVRVLARFFCGNKLYFGNVTNLTERGMFISLTDMSFPFDQNLILEFALANSLIDIPVKVKRLSKTGDIYNGMGVKIVLPPAAYLKYVEIYRRSMSVKDYRQLSACRA